ncbi:MAG: sulfotransferase family protein [Limimaricola soesokkakensis]|uniref:sulfotransferase family protein n=1 Tax=Limimaricola soesokkakensis TaxID=1343159 RepID=UPI00405960B8
MPETGPIFLLGLQRGGTNQILNALRSHPDTYWPNGELHEVLRPRRPASLAALRCWAGYLPTLMRRGDVLNPRRPPGPLGARDLKWLHAALMRACADNTGEVRRYRRALAEQGFGPEAGSFGSRLVVKLVNYNVGLAPDLARIYPDATFIGLMRDPFGICESMMARGARPETILPLYRYVGERLLDLEAQGLPVTIIRLEDMVADFRQVVENVYAACGLDANATSGLCLQRKERVLAPDGRLVGMNKIDTFHAFDSVNAHMRKDVNRAARAGLPPQAVNGVLHSCSALMERFGYATPGDAR